MPMTTTLPSLLPVLEQELPTYISVDVETAGPTPAEFALLSIGACTLPAPRKTFYIELQPDRPAFSPTAMDVHNLDPLRLAADGKPPKEAMQAFADWLAQVMPEHASPVFVAFNAPFDWMFVNDYFIRYTGDNPFGHSAIDIKAFFMGRVGVPWRQTSKRFIDSTLPEPSPLTHHALEDALVQADLFLKVADGRLGDLDRLRLPHQHSY